MDHIRAEVRKRQGKEWSRVVVKRQKNVLSLAKIIKSVIY